MQIAASLQVAHSWRRYAEISKHYHTSEITSLQGLAT